MPETPDTNQPHGMPTLIVLIELMVLAAFLAFALFVPPGPLFGFYVIVAEFLATYLIHCPAHFLVGSVVGIKFRSVRLGHTTLAKVLPPSLSGIARLMPILTLSTDKASRARTPKRRVAYMYASGTVGSVSSALIIAGAASFAEPLTYSALAWAFALIYLAFDVVFSPKSGDLMRAKRSLRP